MATLIKKIFRTIKRNKTFFGKLTTTGLIGFFVALGLIILWIASFQLPNLNNFHERQVAQSTKIYDRTGEIVLYDIHGDYKRTVVAYEDISDYVKWATVAVEDANFYNHNGVEPKAIFRAIMINLKNGNLLGGQGGSTITQQVIKNALLTSDKKISRKVKEWFLAPRLEDKLTKDEILGVYLNEVPYGGNVYGIQEASRRFFAKDAKDLSLAESAYLAALPQAPTYYSPYGGHIDDLQARKNHVLDQMLEHNFITQTEYNQAKDEEVSFQKQEAFGIKAPHFVIWVREQLEEEFGEEAVREGGFNVITTIDYELQEKAEEIVKKYALQNTETYDAENAATVVMDPNTGQILALVGSRDYFDEEIDGNFNIALATRQPGSSIKPIIYAKAFEKGYRPETVVFDVPTEFSTACSSGGSCYSPQNYDLKFRGPMSLRDALAQSVNVPAVKAFYLAGLRDALQLAKNMGLETLTNIDQYGLTLVLGGGEVRLLDMATAYSVFADEGIKHEPTGILKIEDQFGDVLFEYEDEASRVLDTEVTRQVSSVLSDNVARAPLMGSNSPLYFGGIDVAAKTGTTNDYRDAWIIGYTPEFVVASWAGNNDNRSMNKVTGYIVSSMWREIMNEALKLYPTTSFIPPAPQDDDVKPIIRGVWQTEGTVRVDTRTNEPATSDTPERYIKEYNTRTGTPHSILHFVNRNDPLGPAPSNPSSDAQYRLWEDAVVAWASTNNISGTTIVQEPGQTALRVLSPEQGKAYVGNLEITVAAVMSDGSQMKKADVVLNGDVIGQINPATGAFGFIPNDVPQTKPENTLTIMAEDYNGNTYEQTVTFGVR